MSNTQPLADRMRPRSLDEVRGQEHLLAPGKPLGETLNTGRLHSMIFWGPPGTGKTTLARILATAADFQFLSVSAVLGGMKDIRIAIEAAKEARTGSGIGSVLFIDEVHRFNKAQQDAFLPHVEDGTVVFVGATTENPSFEVNNALLSRARVYVLKPLTVEAITELLRDATTDRRRGLEGISVAPKLLQEIAVAADGDGRRALTFLEIASELALAGGGATIQGEHVHETLAGATVRRFDNGGEAFYDLISALHKSIRGSDPDGSLYWLARMLDGGCDPLYLARRLTRIASEDIGNADPRALRICLDAWDTQSRLGSPEGELALAQAVVYMAIAAKSNAVYQAFVAAMRDAKEHGSLEVPLHLRNAPTQLTKSLDYGKAYRYAHDEPNAYAAGEQYLPDELRQTRYYAPVNRGLEIKIAEKLARLRALDAQVTVTQTNRNPARKKTS